MLRSPCCWMMRDAVNYRCDRHPEPADCPDNLIFHRAGIFGLYVHDGGGSYVSIAFCPWCGTELPKSRREFLESLQTQGYPQVDLQG